MDCSDDSAVTGDRPTEEGGAMAHPPRHCHDLKSVGLNVNTIVSVKVDDRCVDPPFDTQLPIDTTPEHSRLRLLKCPGMYKSYPQW